MPDGNDANGDVNEDVDVDLSGAPTPGAQRAQFAQQVREQTGADVRREDVEVVDTGEADVSGVRVTETGQRRIAAREFEEEIGAVDQIDPEQIQPAEDGGFRPGPELQAEIREADRRRFADEIDEEIEAREITEDDLVVRDGGEIELRDEVQRDLQRERAAQEFDQEFETREIRPEDIVIDDGEIRPREEIVEDEQRSKAVRELDEEFDDREISEADIVVEDGEIRVRDEIILEEAASDILEDAPEAYFDADDVVLREAEDGLEADIRDVAQLEFQRDVAVASAAREADSSFVNDLLSELEEEGVIDTRDYRYYQREISRAHTENRAVDFSNVPAEVTEVVAEEVQQRDFLGVDSDVFIETFQEIEGDLTEEQQREFRRELSRAATDDEPINPRNIPEPVVDELTDEEFGQEVAGATAEVTIAQRVAQDAGDLVDPEDVRVDRTGEGIEAEIPQELQQEIAVDELVTEQPDITRDDIAAVDPTDSGFEFEFTREFRRDRAIEEVTRQADFGRDAIADVAFQPTIGERGLEQAREAVEAGEIAEDQFQRAREVAEEGQVAPEDLRQFADEELIEFEFAEEFRREEAAEAFEEEIEGIDIDPADVEIDNGNVRLRDEVVEEIQRQQIEQAREDAVEQFDDEFGAVPIRESDVIFDEESEQFELQDDAIERIEAFEERRIERLREREVQFIRERQQMLQERRQEIAAREIEDEIPVDDLDAGDIEYVAGDEIALTEDIQEEIQVRPDTELERGELDDAAAQLDDRFIQEDITADDLEVEDGEIRLDDDIATDIDESFAAMGAVGAASPEIRGIQAGEAFARVGAGADAEQERVETIETELGDALEDQIEDDLVGDGLEAGDDFVVTREDGQIGAELTDEFLADATAQRVQEETDRVIPEDQIDVTVTDPDAVLSGVAGAIPGVDREDIPVGEMDRVAVPDVQTPGDQVGGDRGEAIDDLDLDAEQPGQRTRATQALPDGDLDISDIPGETVEGIQEGSRDAADWTRREIVGPGAGFAGVVTDQAVNIALTDFTSPSTYQDIDVDPRDIDREDLTTPETTAGQTVESFSAGVGETGPLLVGGPDLAIRLGDASLDIAQTSVSEGQDDGLASGIETGVRETGSAALDVAEDFAQSAVERPVFTAGALVGTGGLMGAAGRVGGGAGRATRWTIQPEAELATGLAQRTVGRTAVGSRAIDAIPGDRIAPEEIALGTVGRVGQTAVDAADFGRRAARGEIDLDLSPRQQAQIETLRPRAARGDQVPETDVQRTVEGTRDVRRTPEEVEVDIMGEQVRADVVGTRVEGDITGADQILIADVDGRQFRVPQSEAEPVRTDPEQPSELDLGEEVPTERAVEEFRRSDAAPLASGRVEESAGDILDQIDFAEIDSAETTQTGIEVERSRDAETEVSRSDDPPLLDEIQEADGVRPFVRGEELPDRPGRFGDIRENIREFAADDRAQMQLAGRQRQRQRQPEDADPRPEPFEDFRQRRERQEFEQRRRLQEDLDPPQPRVTQRMESRTERRREQAQRPEARTRDRDFIAAGPADLTSELEEEAFGDPTDPIGDVESIIGPPDETDLRTPSDGAGEELDIELEMHPRIDPGFDPSQTDRARQTPGIDSVTGRALVPAADARTDTDVRTAQMPRIDQRLEQTTITTPGLDDPPDPSGEGRQFRAPRRRFSGRRPRQRRGRRATTLEDIDTEEFEPDILEIDEDDATFETVIADPEDLGFDNGVFDDNV